MSIDELYPAECRLPTAVGGPGMGRQTRREEEFDGDALVRRVGEMLHRLRHKKRFSLERLAGLCGVSRAMLSQIELGRSTPTIKTLCKIAAVFDVPVGVFLDQAVESVPKLTPRRAARWTESSHGQVRSRALISPDGEGPFGFYEIRMSAGATESRVPEDSGSQGNCLVADGEIEITISSRRFALHAGDVLHFRADVAHAYRNVGSAEAVLYLVVSAPVAKG